ncbi:xylose isomerase domain-containing protein [Scenedesmus sp. NREL 46B-D3]|nr:xylose isomerase domain-containing protein [Scenedesmus sp. NREL 46B-D3]
MTRRIFSEHGIGAACSLGLSLDADISSDDSAVVAKGAAELDKALNFAAAVGASHLCGVLYSAMAKYALPPTKQGRANCARELKALAAKAADNGVKVCLEVVNRYETNLLNTAAQAMELIEGKVQHPNVYVHLDSYHMNIEESSLEAAVRLCGKDRLGYIHLGESHRGYMGSGAVDFTGLFRGLADIKYTGPITFESFSSAVVSPELSNNLCVWRNLWSDSGDLAQHARGCIHQQWRAALITAQQSKSSNPVV